MANDFSGTEIKEYWRFENNLTAGKSGNDLAASAGGVAYESGSPMEGSYSLDLAAGSNQWAWRSDANLSTGFPLKNGDSVKKVSWACWIKPESMVVDPHYIISKYRVLVNKRTLALVLQGTGDYLRVLWGYNSGASAEGWEPVSLVAGRKYHVGLAVDGIAKTALIRLWDDYNGTATTYTKSDWAGELSISDSHFVVGNRGDLDNTYDYDGLIDEVVVANAVLTADDFDQIRQGTYGATSIKTIIGLPIASCKLIQGLAKADMKTWGGLA